MDAGFGGMLDGKSPLGKLTRRWEDNNKIDLRKIGWVGVEWIYLAQNREE
jgi:hypothetical protein